MRYVGPRQIVIDDNPTPVPFWEPGREFEGMTIVIVGGGPSHAAMDLGVLRGHRFIAINSACRKVSPIAAPEDMLLFSDNSWNENHPELARDWPGRVVTSNRNAKARLGAAVRRIDLDPITLAVRCLPDHIHASSGHTAAGLAAVMGARRIVLIGFECRAVDGRTHGHNDYQQHDMDAFEDRFLPGWRGLAPAFSRMGVEVLNATPDSALREFPFMPLTEALA